MTNFGILMEIKGIEDPFKWSRDVVQKLQQEYMVRTGRPKDTLVDHNKLVSYGYKEKSGLYYSPKATRFPSSTSENEIVKSYQIPNLDLFKETLGKYADYILNFIDQMNKVFEFGNDWGIYIPEVKYLSPEPLVNYTNLSLNEYPNVYFVGDALSARGITVSGAHGVYVAEYLLS
jgi:hypothetical protein